MRGRVVSYKGENRNRGFVGRKDSTLKIRVLKKLKKKR